MLFVSNKKLAGLLLLGSAVAADVPNFQFSAIDNTQPIFEEKCAIWLSALEQSDMPLLLSFLDPKLVEMHPEPLQRELDYMIRNQQRIAATPAELTRSIALSKPGVTLEHIANVNVDYSYEKGHIGISCGFERTASGYWQLML